MSVSSKNDVLKRWGMFLPLVLMVAAVAASCCAYSDARRDIADDLNDAMIALAHENSRLWTRQDTIAALRQMRETTRQPVICRASDATFRHSVLKNDAYFTLALIDGNNAVPEVRDDIIASDSILIVPERGADGLAIRLQGFADCSVAAVLAVSNQTLPGVLFALAVLSTVSMFFWRRKSMAPVAPSVDGIRLTPMQRQFTRMLLDAPGRKVDKSVLCVALWGNKSNAEESLYTLVRRTKAALAEAGMEIVCHRGEAYELRINR